MEKEKQGPSYVGLKDLKSVSFQKLGCYFMFRQLPKEDQSFILELFTDQTAVFNLMVDAFEKEYQRCIDKDGKSVAEPDLEYLMNWRKKMHECYDYNKLVLENYIENVSTNAKKKQKKKYQKMKTDKGLYESSIVGGEIDTDATMSRIKLYENRLKPS